MRPFAVLAATALTLPSSRGGGLGRAASLPGAAAASDLPYGYYDDLRRRARAGGGGVRSAGRAGSVDVVSRADCAGSGEACAWAAADPPAVGLCHVAGVNGFSFGRDGALNPTSLNKGAAALLAAHHFNAGDGSIVREFAGINERCDVRLTVEFSDCLFSEFEALKAVTEVVTRGDGEDEGPRPCVLLGASRSSSTYSTSILASVHNLPSMSYDSGSADLSDSKLRPLFSRVLTSTDESALIGVRYLRRLGYRRCTALYLNDLYGASLQRATLEGAGAAGIDMLSVPIPPNWSDEGVAYEGEGREGVRAAVAKAAEHGYRCVVLNIPSLPELFVAVMKEAAAQAFVGPDHFWFLQNELLYDGQSFPAALAGAVAGVGQLKPVSKVDAFKRVYSDLPPAAVDHFAAKLPAKFNQTFRDHYPGTDLDWPAIAYDTVASMALAACNVTGATAAGAFFDGPRLGAALRHGTLFDGATGVVRINPDTLTREATSQRFVVQNVRPARDARRAAAGPAAHGGDGAAAGTAAFALLESYVYAPNADGTGWEEFEVDPFMYADGTTTPPADLPPLNGGRGVDMNFIGRSVRATAYVMCALSVLTATGCAAWTFNGRKNRVVRASQPTFLYLICVGSTLLALTIVPLGMDDENFDQRQCDVACMAVPWTGAVGYSLAFAALFSKLWKVNKVIRRPTDFTRVTVRTRDVMAPLLLLLFVNVVTLIVWTVVNPLVYVRTASVGTDRFDRIIDSRGACASSNPDAAGGAVPYVAVLATINTLCLLLANFQAYKARNISTDFQETKYIALSMASILQVVIVAIPVLFLVPDSNQVRSLIMSTTLFIVTMALQLFMFVPKVKYSRKVEAAKAEQRRQKQERIQAAIEAGALPAGALSLPSNNSDATETSSGLMFRVNKLTKFNDAGILSRGPMRMSFYGTPTGRRRSSHFGQKDPSQEEKVEESPEEVDQSQEEKAAE